MVCMIVVIVDIPFRSCEMLQRAYVDTIFSFSTEVLTSIKSIYTIFFFLAK